MLQNGISIYTGKTEKAERDSWIRRYRDTRRDGRKAWTSSFASSPSLYISPPFLLSDVKPSLLPLLPSVFIKVFQCSLFTVRTALFVCLSVRNVDTWIRCILLLLEIRFWKLSICAPGTSARNPRVCAKGSIAVWASSYSLLTRHSLSSLVPGQQDVATVCRSHVLLVCG
jgi:hypothetical protein